MVVISDQGREFINQLSDCLFKKTNTEHQITSAYHPQVSNSSCVPICHNYMHILLFVQTNGLTERFNQTLSRSLVKVINDSQDNWDEKIDAILFGYRVTKHCSTGYTPFYMMYHREASLPIDAEIMPDHGGDEREHQMDEYIDTMLNVKENLQQSAIQNIEKSQEKQKKHYDERHCTKV